MKCPVCKRNPGIYSSLSIMEPQKLDNYEYPLYQQSYPGSPFHISPRCVHCFDKAIKKKSRHESRKNSGKIFQKTVPAVPKRMCKNCLAELGVNPKLTDYGRLTEQVLGSCANCLAIVQASIENRLNCEPDYDNAVVGPGYEIGINYPQVVLVPMKKIEHPARILLRTEALWRKILLLE